MFMLKQMEVRLTINQSGTYTINTVLHDEVEVEEVDQRVFRPNINRNEKMPYRGIS